MSWRLRHDIEPDGRHTKVEFTDDWLADAARRDFTFNALYLDGRGRIHTTILAGERIWKIVVSGLLATRRAY